MKRPLTNEDLIKNLMNFSPYGGLCQAFIMQGIRYYCQEVIAEKENMIKAEEEMMIEGKIPILSQKTWLAIAEDIVERMDIFYDEKSIKKLKYE